MANLKRQKANQWLFQAKGLGGKGSRDGISWDDENVLNLSCSSGPSANAGDTRGTGWIPGSARSPGV